MGKPVLIFETMFFGVFFLLSIKLGYRVTGALHNPCKSIFDGIPECLVQLGFSSTSGPKVSQFMGNGWSAIGYSGNSRLAGGEYYQGQGVGNLFYYRVRMGHGSVGLFWHMFFLWNSLLTRSGVGMTGISSRGIGEVTGLGLHRHYDGHLNGKGLTNVCLICHKVA